MATDDKGGIGIDDLHVIVPILLPARIEAEDYTLMSGVRTENAWGDPEGGGQHVGWIDKGDWIEYRFVVPTEGEYHLKLRVASQVNGGTIQIMDQKGRVLARVAVPNTGGWQKWQTISSVIRLSRGLQTVRLQSPSEPIWNINWWELSAPR